VALARSNQVWFAISLLVIHGWQGNHRRQWVEDFHGSSRLLSYQKFQGPMWLSFQVVRESTGRNDTEGRDFCEDLVEFTS
jgi:hypothetical protein